MFAPLSEKQHVALWGRLDLQGSRAGTCRQTLLERKEAGVRGHHVPSWRADRAPAATAPRPGMESGRRNPPGDFQGDAGGEAAPSTHGEREGSMKQGACGQVVQIQNFGGQSGRPPGIHQGSTCAPRTPLHRSMKLGMTHSGRPGSHCPLGMVEKQSPSSFVGCATAEVAGQAAAQAGPRG